MIWGYHYFRKHPVVHCLIAHLQTGSVIFGIPLRPPCGPREAAKPVVSMVPSANNPNGWMFKKKQGKTNRGSWKQTNPSHFILKGTLFFLKMTNHTKLQCLIPPMWITKWFLPNETQKCPKWYAPNPPIGSNNNWYKFSSSFKGFLWSRDSPKLPG